MSFDILIQAAASSVLKDLYESVACDAILYTKNINSLSDVNLSLEVISRCRCKKIFLDCV